ncbi:hypothetical protein LTR97_011353 [Elasticomyces elasticus]|uniref:Uncharacterized protein n=1 Tax=Elasticomyces elasticus TaxID=574655 RepID=A0AAN7VYS0_9PEZI|nr:hypothetical protein LTR97_011353 [Elasticomyces elasticus]
MEDLDLSSWDPSEYHSEQMADTQEKFTARELSRRATIGESTNSTFVQDELGEELSRSPVRDAEEGKSAAGAASRALPVHDSCCAANDMHATLEDRVRLLEAKLKESAAGRARLDYHHPNPRNMATGSDRHLQRPSLRPLRLDTNLPGILAHNRSYSFDDSSSRHNWSYSADAMDGAATPEVPVIQIIEPNDFTDSMPGWLSPSLSLMSATTRSSTFESSPTLAPTMDVTLGLPRIKRARTPPLGGSFDYAGNPHLDSLWAPHSPVSRRSSVSSLGGVELDINALTLELAQDEPWSSPSVFGPTSYDEHETDPFSSIQIPYYPQHSAAASPLSPLPSLVEAQSLANFAFDNCTDIYLDRQNFQHCLSAMYSLASLTTDKLNSAAQMCLASTPFSLGVAKAHVSPILAIALRMMTSVVMDGRMMNNCYFLAMNQMQHSGFWFEDGTLVVTDLLRTFAEAGSYS